MNARGHFPTEQAALKCLYLAIMSLDPTGRGRKRWTNRWKAALNAFDITSWGYGRPPLHATGRSELSVQIAGPAWAGFMPSSSLVRDALLETGRIW